MTTREEERAAQERLVEWLESTGRSLTTASMYTGHATTYARCPDWESFAPETITAYLSQYSVTTRPARMTSIRRLQEFIEGGGSFVVRSAAQVAEDRVTQAARPKRADTPFETWLMTEYGYSRRIARSYQGQVLKERPKRLTGVYKAAQNKLYEFENFRYMSTAAMVCFRLSLWALRRQNMGITHVQKMRWEHVSLRSDGVYVTHPTSLKLFRRFPVHTWEYKALRHLREWACPWEASDAVFVTKSGTSEAIPLPVLRKLVATEWTDAMLEKRGEIFGDITEALKPEGLQQVKPKPEPKEGNRWLPSLSPGTRPPRS